VGKVVFRPYLVSIFKDTLMTQGVVNEVSSIAIVIGNLIADLIAPFVDPRIRLK
jgi:ABC-type dipeptide/oligopeptide/nickel transport system permease component